jgi:hypothetical protein
MDICMKRFVIILLLLNLTPVTRITFAQTLKLGFRVEQALLIIEDKFETSVSYAPFGFYLSALLQPSDWLAFEARPGIFIAYDKYYGLEFGIFARARILPTRFYLIAGLNNHVNGSSGHNSGGSYEKEMLYNAIGIGFQKDSRLGIDLMYYWTNNKVFGYSYDGSSRTYTNMNGIIKLGFSLAWDIL